MKTSIVLAVAGLAVAGTAQAHTHLEKAVPADNAVLISSPAQVVLEFSEAARLTAASLKKEGEKDSTKLAPLPKERAATLTVPLAPLTPGKYILDWRVVGEDSHVMSGKLHFELKPK